MSFRNVTFAFVVTAGLGALAACASSDATDPLSSSGQKTATGQPGNQPGSEPPVLPNASRVFLWSPGAEMQVLPMPSYALEMVATDINDAGQVVGYVLLDMSGYTRAFVWSAAGGYLEIGSLNGPEGPAIATSVNASGTVTGLSVGPEGILNGPMGIPLPHAFIWTAASGMKSLGEISGLASFGPVNAAGTIVGQGKNGTFFWNATTGFQNVPLPPGMTCSRTVDMNDKGQIVGYAGSGRDCFEFYSPFIWDIDGNHILIEKCDHSLWCSTNVRAINNRGEVTGSRNGAAFRWSREGGFITIPGNATGEDINDDGDVAGGSWNDQLSKPFVWLATGAITTIELPPGSSSGYATAINNKRQVIGNFH